MSILYIRNANGELIPVPTLKGDPGANYVLTEADMAEIAEQASELVNIPTKISELEDDVGYLTDPLVLTDQATNKKYKLAVMNGKLTMTEVE